MRQVLFGEPISQPLTISVAVGPFSHSDSRFAFQVIANHCFSLVLSSLLLCFRCVQHRFQSRHPGHPGLKRLRVGHIIRVQV